MKPLEAGGGHQGGVPCLRLDSVPRYAPRPRPRVPGIHSGEGHALRIRGQPVGPRPAHPVLPTCRMVVKNQDIGISIDVLVSK
jgi:hypothetical protein